MPSCATASPSPATAASANRSRKRKGRRSLITAPSENALVLTQHLIQRAIDLHADLLLNVDIQVDDDRILRRFDAHRRLARRREENRQQCRPDTDHRIPRSAYGVTIDRKSTRLNSSH